MTTSSIFRAELKHYVVHTEERHWRHWLRRRLVQIELYAGGKPLVDYGRRSVYLRRLKASLEGDGTYELFVCACGYAFCDALPNGAVQVRHEGDWVYWRHSGALPPADYRFDRQQFREEILRLEKELYSWFAANQQYLDPSSHLYVMSPKEVFTEWREHAQ